MFYYELYNENRLLSVVQCTVELLQMIKFLNIVYSFK